MPTVFYDSDAFSRQQFGGISRYFAELIRNLPEGWDYLLPTRVSGNAYLSMLPRRHHIAQFAMVPPRIAIPAALRINAHADRRALARGGYDIVHLTGASTPLLPLLHTPLVVTVHDLIHEHLRDKRLPLPPAAARLKETIMAADGIIAVSQATRRDLVNLYGIPEERITVIYHGHSGPPAVQPPPVAGLPERYILYVGNRGPSKNFTNMLRAFDIVARRDRSLHLVCTGAPFSHAEGSMIASLSSAGRVVQRFFPTTDMPALYAHAGCYVFPSLLEGFGMPVLEAFAAGCPVALSRTSCLPEIAGEGGIYFNPFDPSDMAARISEALYDNRIRLRHVAAGRKVLKRFSWRHTALQTTNLYSTLLSR